MNMAQVYCNTLPSMYDKYVRMASRHIDAFTFYRIPTKGGLQKLPDRQRDIVEMVCEEHAKFLLENEAYINSILSSYSLNGASVTLDFNGKTVYCSGGIIMLYSLYGLLKSSGLCCRLIK